MAIQTAILALLLDEEDNENSTTTKKIWVRPWLSNRRNSGAFHVLFSDLKLDNQAFKEYLRLDKTQFEVLLQKVYKHLIKQDTNMRECIKPEEMCCLTLRYLASGESFRSLEFQFRIGRKTISSIILDVTKAIVKELSSDYLSTPTTTAKWLEISQKFLLRWNFPNGIGAIDGKHIVIEQPSNSGSHYRNYKGTDSVILMGMIGPEYEFLYADVGINGRNSDGGIWANCSLKIALESNAINVPDPEPLPHRSKIMPFVCTGDDAFPLSKYMMKPYPFKSLSVEKKIFNYRLSRMRRISENAFGILANRWRVFRRPFLLEPDKVKIITLATITLHNWLRSDSNKGKVYIPSGLVDREDIESGRVINGSWRSDEIASSWLSLPKSRGNHASNQANEIREEFTEYFTKEGCVPWQWKCARVDL